MLKCLKLAQIVAKTGPCPGYSPAIVIFAGLLARVAHGPVFQYGTIDPQDASDLNQHFR